MQVWCVLESQANVRVYNLHQLIIYSFTVRLVDGGSYNEGRVEVYYNGEWGTVCNDGWNDTYASLVCAQLGFGSSGELVDFGYGTGNIFLENVMCTSNDTILASCGHYGVGITVRCNHFRDAGVKCQGMIANNFHEDFICILGFTTVTPIMSSITQALSTGTLL